jgi:hypothetical protein
MIYHAKADTAEEIAKLLRQRGRTIVTAPPRSGKTTELIRYAEERYPNGRFVVVAKEEQHPYIVKLHWCLSNGISFVDVVAKRLLGQELEGEFDVNPPTLLTPETVMYRTWNASTPLLVDEWSSLPEAAHRAILKHRLFIASVTS